MAHTVIGDKVVVDWKTGDPEGDRITLLAAYRDFIKEIKRNLDSEQANSGAVHEIYQVFDRWQIDTENQIDDVPRVWIKRPEQ